MLRTIKFIILSYLLVSCQSSLPIEDDIANVNFKLLDQSNNQFSFASDLNDNSISVVGFIFTNCPDICPLTTNNMRLTQERLNENNIKGVDFYSITFDPDVDTPNVLTNFAKLRELDLSNWQFLTGEPQTIDSLMKRMHIMAVVGDSTVMPDGEKIYYYIHTDRITLIDREKKVRKEYLGSKLNIDEIFNDIKKLL